MPGRGQAPRFLFKADRTASPVKGHLRTTEGEEEAGHVGTWEVWWGGARHVQGQEDQRGDSKMSKGRRSRR